MFWLRTKKTSFDYARIPICRPPLLMSVKEKSRKVATSTEITFLNVEKFERKKIEKKISRYSHRYLCRGFMSFDETSFILSAVISFSLSFLMSIYCTLAPQDAWFKDILLSPAFSKKSGGTLFSAFRPSVLPSVLPSFRPPNIVGTLCAQLLLQFYADSFETLQMF